VTLLAIHELYVLSAWCVCVCVCVVAAWLARSATRRLPRRCESHVRDDGPAGPAQLVCVATAQVGELLASGAYGWDTRRVGSRRERHGQPPHEVSRQGVGEARRICGNVRSALSVATNGDELKSAL